MRVCARRRPRRRSDGGSRPSPPCKAGSAEGRFGEHLNEATITRLGSILECGNMSPQLFDTAHTNFERLSSGTAQRVLKFWQRREAAPSAP